MITVTSLPRLPEPQDRPLVSLPVDDVAVLLGLLDLLIPAGQSSDEALYTLAARIRTRLSVAIAAAVEVAPSEDVHSA